jgi:putative ABC transport system substrate-binding protein
VRRIAIALTLWLTATVPALAQDRTALPLVAMLRVATSASKPGLPSTMPTGCQSLPNRWSPTGQASSFTAGILAMADDLIGTGPISNLARPAGNIIGVSIFATELDAKKLDMLRQILPTSHRIGVLGDAASSSPARLQAITEAAQALGIELQIVDVQSAADTSAAFASFRAGGTEAIDILASPLLFASREQLGRLSLADKLPAICQFREMIDAGCIASYGVSLPDAYVVLAAMTDKVLRGAQPGSIPAQQPTHFELVINQKAALAMGIEIHSRSSPPPAR